MELTRTREAPSRPFRLARDAWNRRHGHHESCAGLEAITKEKAEKMILDAQWVSPGDFDELRICMPCGKRFLLIWPMDGTPMLEQVPSA